MSHDDDYIEPGRRTGFVKDMREFFAKIIFGLFLGLIFYIFMPSGFGWLPLILGIVSSFFFASCIRGSSRHAD